MVSQTLVFAFQIARMTKLSEKEVLSRSRAACLSNVRKLITWGSDLTDISVVRDTVNLEVLNVSVNKLTTLTHLSHCPKLKELYVRRNCIQNIQEVAFLKNLPQLTVLWINDNPMCDGVEFYRETIIRNLPNLTKLDSVVVTDEERRRAEKVGSVLDTDEILPNFDGLDLNHTLTDNAVALHIKNNLCLQQRLQCSNSDGEEKLPIIEATTVHPTAETNGHIDQDSEESEIGSTNGSDLRLTDSTTSTTPEKDSNTVSAVKLLLDTMNVADLQKIFNHTQSLLRSENSECSRGIVLED